MVRNYYSCKHCEFKTLGRSNYNIHITTKKHIEKVRRHREKLKIFDEEDTDTDNTKDLRTIVSELSQTIQAMGVELEEHRDLINRQAKEISELKKRPCGSGHITNNGHIGTINNMINIGLTPFNRSKLPNNLDVVEILKGVNTCWAELLSKKFFNPDVPEQNNLRIVNQQKRISKTYDGTQWNTTETQHLIKNMVDDLSDELDICGAFEKFRKDSSEFIQNQFIERYNDGNEIKVNRKDIKNIEHALIAQQKRLRLSVRV